MKFKFPDRGSLHIGDGHPKVDFSDWEVSYAIITLVFVFFGTSIGL